MSRLLLIVSRGEPGRYTYLKHVYGSEAVEVIVDRRVGQRRQGQRSVAQRSAAVERRRDGRRQRDLTEERRQRDLTEELQTLGWALVRH